MTDALFKIFPAGSVGTECYINSIYNNTNFFKIIDENSQHPVARGNAIVAEPQVDIFATVRDGVWRGSTGKITQIVFDDFHTTTNPYSIIEIELEFFNKKKLRFKSSNSKVIYDKVKVLEEFSGICSLVKEERPKHKNVIPEDRLGNTVGLGDQIIVSHISGIKLAIISSVTPKGMIRYDVFFPKKEVIEHEKHKPSIKQSKKHLFIKVSNSIREDLTMQQIAESSQ